MALANQKGGVGKTTTAIHLAHGLAIAGQTAVILDLDPQGNATLAVQGMSCEEDPQAGDAFAPLRPLGPRLWILPSPGAERSLARSAELDVAGLEGLVHRLDESGVDWLIVDCPPRMDQWGWAGLQLTAEVMVPVPPEFFPMHGLGQMVATLAEARAEFPGRAALLGVLVTMLDRQDPLALEVLEDLRSNLGDQLLQTVIYRDPQLVEAASHGQTLFEYNVFARGARAYGELIREVMYGRQAIG